MQTETAENHPTVRQAIDASKCLAGGGTGTGSFLGSSLNEGSFFRNPKEGRVLIKYKRDP